MRWSLGLTTLAIAIGMGAFPPYAAAAWHGAEGRVALLVETDEDTPFESRIVTVKPDGSDPVVVRSCTAGQSEPCGSVDTGAVAWSPDGRRLAVIVEDRLAIVNADGSDWRVITSGNTYAREPAWSPDGDRIAFQRLRGSSFADSDLVTVNADGSGLRRLTAGVGVSDVAWSSRNQIAYIRSAPRRQIVKVNTAGRHQRVLSAPVDPRALDWSPSGKTVLFTAKDRKSGRYSTWTVDNLGKWTRLRARGVINAFWSPTGRRIASLGDDTFNLSRVDGSGLRSVRLQIPGDWGFPKPQAWQAIPR